MIAPPPLVELSNAEVRLGGARVLSGVSFALHEGESWALLGPNGSGKSTLLRLLRGEVWPHHEGGGRRLFHLAGAAEESPIGVRERIGLVSAELQQEYVRRDWALRAEAVVRSGFTDSVWPPEAATPAQTARIAEVLAMLGIAHLADRSVLELSSGEARRVLLARALASRPRLLFLDEPCHGLDAAARESFLGLVSGVVREGTPIVLATHRYDELVPEITRVAVMHAGRILAQGGREEILHRHRTAPRPFDSAPLRGATLRVSGEEGPLAIPEPARPGGGPPLLLSEPARAAGDPPFALSVAQRSRSAASPPRPLISIEHADVRVDGRPVLHDLSWHVREGESWAVVGPNGAGKSTLLRLVVGDEQAMPGGKVRRLQLGERASVWEVKARVGIVSPELQARHRMDLVVDDVVASGFTASIGLDAPPTASERARAAACLARAGVAHLAGRHIHALSYGELRKVLLARALVQDPELLVLDEPADGLDPESRASLLDSVQRLCESGTHLVLVTHHEEDLVPAIDHVLELAGGRAVYQGPRAGWRARVPGAPR
ncbi:MAG: ABC transporter ATP-binding protein [Anaeromyxobacteraceae bacterium]